LICDHHFEDMSAREFNAGCTELKRILESHDRDRLSTLFNKTK